MCSFARLACCRGAVGRPIDRSVRFASSLTLAFLFLTLVSPAATRSETREGGATVARPRGGCGRATRPRRALITHALDIPSHDFMFYFSLYEFIGRESSRCLTSSVLIRILLNRGETHSRFKTDVSSSLRSSSTWPRCSCGYST